MTDVLAGIVSRKREEVAALPHLPLSKVAPSRRSLRAALGKPDARFIMEVKRASPSGHRSRHSVEDAANAYASIADAISVLTDGPDFGGSLQDILQVRRDFDGPILAKDFVVDPRQIVMARAAGADAVLVMMSVLDNKSAEAMLTTAGRLNMEAIVEVHDEAELRRALALGARIVGINNRDLKTLRTDLEVTERLAPLVPRDVTVIAESGISGRSDVTRLARHADAFLVGSSLMASDDVSEAARALVHGRVKLCGLTCEEDVALAADGGATHAGFIFVPGTPRCVAVDRARELAKEARFRSLKAVGVFRDADPREVAEVADELDLDAVQLHGCEDVAAVRSGLAEAVEIWALCGVNGAAGRVRSGADRTLFDTQRNGHSGGTGTTFDWSLVGNRPDLPSAFLAGGIGPGNAAAAAQVGAFGLDVGSAIESRPGRKDPAKTAALFAALRPTARTAS
jgi:indole-3-glycerol phosphate synthase/phosphoribosylanthranilate isomerase